MVNIKYCLRCGEIVADNSTSKDRTACSECGMSYEEDNMTGEMFESLSENEKQQYANKLFAIIKSSKSFDEKLFNDNVRRYGEASLYESWWYDKAEQLGARFILRYETDEERKQRLNKQYGKNSPAYQQAVVQNCISAERARKEESRNVPKCPTCQSANLRKIATTSKVANTALFGIFGTKRHKTFHCNNCGYEW